MRPNNWAPTGPHSRWQPANRGAERRERPERPGRLEGLERPAEHTSSWMASKPSSGGWEEAELDGGGLELQWAAGRTTHRRRKWAKRPHRGKAERQRERRAPARTAFRYDTAGSGHSAAPSVGLEQPSVRQKRCGARAVGVETAGRDSGRDGRCGGAGTTGTGGPAERRGR
ncbi:hypothetical protein VTN31DRAFT_6863 [Thermomyces dupontii]|uniref:uncharacterized protein n=1 Tax=Talaromyces thermophilus TaxID=28565 RepID=UPI0037434803